MAKSNKRIRNERTSDYVCQPCGVGYLSEKQLKDNSVSTYSVSECGLCHKKTSTTHMRHFNYLTKPYEPENKLKPGDETTSEQV